MKKLQFSNYEITASERFNRTVSVFIVITMVFLIFYFISFSWFGESDFAVKDITVGDIQISVRSTLSFGSTKLEPHKIYNMEVSVVGAAKNTNDAFVRIKIETTPTINGNPVVFPSDINNQKWILHNGWYYYLGFINKVESTRATLATKFQASNELTNQHTKSKVYITLKVHAIQAEFYDTADAYWQGAPTQWLNYVNNVYNG